MLLGLHGVYFFNVDGGREPIKEVEESDSVLLELRTPIGEVHFNYSLIGSSTAIQKGIMYLT